MNYKSAPSPLARSSRSKSITDNTDATDFVLSRILFMDYSFNWISMRLYGALIITDFR